jgi:integrase
MRELMRAQNETIINPQAWGGYAFMGSDLGSSRYDKKSKTWYVDLWLDGVNHRIYRMPIQGGMLIPCTSKEMAEALRKVINTQIDQGIFYPDRFKKKKQHAFVPYSDAWLERQKHLMEATARDYRGYLDNHLQPFFKQKLIADITKNDLEDLINWMPTGPKSKQNVLGCMMKILHDAESAHDIDKAPDRPEMRGNNKVVDPEVIWLEPEEQTKILEALALQYRKLIRFGMLTGVRPSEARALMKSNIKWARKEIVISHTFDYKGNFVRVKGKKALPVPMDEDLEALIKEAIDEQKEPSTFVFINPATGKPFSRNINKVFGRACKKALGLKIGIAKATRTSFAQQLANEGVDIHMVSRWLRHSGTKITKRYYEYQTSSMKSAIDKVRKIK